KALPGASLQAARPTCSLMECPDDFESSSQYGLDLLFGAPAEEKAGSAASEGEREPSEADATTELTAPAAKSQSVVDAEMAAALQRAAKEIGVVWVPLPSPEPSRLDDWFLGSGRDSRPRSSPVPFFPEVHEELTKSWKAPLLVQSRYTNSLSLTTLNWGPARGYTEVAQVERAVVMHLYPQNAASWRGRPGLPSRACKFSSALIAKAYAASGQAASALHAMAILQVYQAKSCCRNCVLRPTMLNELRRAMSTMVVQERHLWLNLAEMRDAEKVRFLDAPISHAGLFGKTVEEFAQQFSTVKKQTEAIKHILPRCAVRASPAPPKQQPPPAPIAQAPQPAGPAARPAKGPVLVGRPQRTLLRLRSIPEMGSPGKEDRLTFLRQQRCVLLLKDAIETVPSAEMKKGFYSPYFIVPKKGGGLRPILDLREDGLISTKFFPLAFPCCPTSLRREVGISILNYLNDWLILAHMDMVLNHLAQLGLQVNWEKSKLSPAHRISFLGVEQHSDVGLRHGHAAGFDAHETATTLASYLSPEMGMAPRHVSCDHIVSQDTQPLDRHCVPVVRDTSLSPQMLPKQAGVPPPTALAHQLPRVVDSAFSPEEHVLVRSDNTATVAYINHQGGVHSFCMSQLACHLLLSLRATHIPGKANRVADSLLHPHQGGQGTDSLGGPVLAQQNLVLGPGASGISPSLAHSSEEGPPLSGEGHNLAPAHRSLELPPMVPGRDQVDFRDLSPSVVNTLLQARAPSTRWLDDLKWRIFVNWCSSRGKDPQRCGIESVLSFLQEGLDRHLSASTLKVHVAAISANHDLVGGRSVGKHDLVIRLNSPRPHLIPSWDLVVVLQGLQQDPFEPL
ncbi:hypothetical protein M9458_043827, partial [Cirrhinus mrigala]